MDTRRLTIFCDGGSRGNPGPSASAFVAYNPDGVLIADGKKYIGIATNNVAEYTAVVMALSWLREYSIKYFIPDTEIVLDSQLLAMQLTGQYRVKSEHLRELYDQAKSLEKDISGSINYIHVLRDKNERADALVNQVLDRDV